MRLDTNSIARAHNPGTGKLCQCDDCKAVRVRRLSPFDHGTKQAYKVGCRCERCVDSRKRYDEARKNR